MTTDEADRPEGIDASTVVRWRAGGALALDTYGTEASTVRHLHRTAVRLIESSGGDAGTGSTQRSRLALLPGVKLRDGTIEALIAGAPRQDAPADMRGFVGLVFHVSEDLAEYECIFLRPTNGRAQEQLRRNHSTQYMAIPDFPWNRLRNESPGVYESYVDLVPGAWTRMRVVVAGTRALLYVGGAKQPCLVVNDLKLGSGEGRVGFWIGTGTEAHVSKLVADARDPG